MLKQATLETTGKVDIMKTLRGMHLFLKKNGEDLKDYLFTICNGTERYAETEVRVDRKRSVMMVSLN